MKTETKRRGKHYALYKAYKQLEDEGIIQKLTEDQIRVRFSKFKRNRKESSQLLAVLFCRLNLIDYADHLLARIDEVILPHYGIRGGFSN